jgi:HlyD family secretion protein
MDHAMDRVLAPRRRWPRRAAVAAGAVAGGALILYMALRGGAQRILAVASDRIELSPVTQGAFDDFIPIRSRAAPARTTYLDSAHGGQVVAIHVEDGAAVSKGQLLVELSNTTLQLDVISREAQITEQLNNVRALELAHEQNRAAHERELVEVDHQIARLTRELDRSDRLAAVDALPRATKEDLDEELAYYKRRREVAVDSFRATDRLQRVQLDNLRAAATQLERNLWLARRNLDGLEVKAPSDGRLSAFSLEIGQSVAPGERLGQIDDPARFKLIAEIDEFYLNRVDLGQTAEGELGGRSYRLRVAKIRPEVKQGRFEADLAFDGDSPDVRRGQTAQLKLQLGQPSEAVLVANGAFYQDTGGAWVFVLSPDGRHAVKRNVRLGRRNPQVIEVLDGLRPGETVVTSSYANYLTTDRLELDQP